MINKVILAGVVGASVFGIAAASASALGNDSQNGSVIQDSQQVSATCTANAQYTNVADSTSGNLLDTHFSQQGLETPYKTPGCENDFVQVSWTTPNGTFYSDILQIPQTNQSEHGLDFFLKPPQAISAAEITSTDVIIAGEIHHAGSTVVYEGTPAQSPNYAGYFVAP